MTPHLSPPEEAILQILSTAPRGIADLISAAGWCRSDITDAVARLRRLGMIQPPGRLGRQPAPRFLAGLTGLRRRIMIEIYRSNDAAIPATALDVATRLGASTHSVRTYLSALTREGYLYPAGTMALISGSN